MNQIRYPFERVTIGTRTLLIGHSSKICPMYRKVAADLTADASADALGWINISKFCTQIVYLIMLKMPRKKATLHI